MDKTLKTWVVMSSDFRVTQFHSNLLYANEAEKHYPRGMKYFNDSCYGKVENLVEMGIIAFKCASFLGHNGAKIKLATYYSYIESEKAHYYLKSAVEKIRSVDSVAEDF